MTTYTRRQVIRYRTPRANGMTDVEETFTGSGSRTRAEKRVAELVQTGKSVTLVTQEFRGQWKDITE